MLAEASLDGSVLLGAGVSRPTGLAGMVLVDVRDPRFTEDPDLAATGLVTVFASLLGIATASPQHGEISEDAAALP